MSVPEPASVVAARQLAGEARARRAAALLNPRRPPTRRPIRRPVPRVVDESA